MTSFELIPRIGVELTTRHIPGVVDPLSSAVGVVRAVRAVLVACRRTARRVARKDRWPTRTNTGWVSMRRSRRAIASARRSGGCANRFPRRSARTAPASSTTSPCRCRRCRVHRGRRQVGGAAHSAGRARRLRASRRWQPALQHQPAAGTQVAQLQAVEQKVKRAIHDFVKEFGGSFIRRARHRPAEGVRARALRESGRARSHAAREARVRSERDHEPGQGPAA